MLAPKLYGFCGEWSRMRRGIFAAERSPMRATALVILVAGGDQEEIVYNAAVRLSPKLAFSNTRNPLMGHLVRDWRRTGEQPPAHLLLPRTAPSGVGNRSPRWGFSSARRRHIFR